MVNLIGKVLVVALVVAVMAPCAMAQENSASVEAQVNAGGGGMHPGTFGVLGAVLGAGIVVFGAANGISKIAAAAVDAIARQPEAGGRIFTSMLMASAFIEGGMLFGLIVCIMAVVMLV